MMTQGPKQAPKGREGDRSGQKGRRLPAACFLALWPGLLILSWNSPVQGREGSWHQAQSPSGSLPDDCTPKCYQEADRRAKRCLGEMADCRGRSPEKESACRHQYRLCDQKVTEWAQRCLDLCGKDLIRPH
jgi:hypothetical protein